jgi:hypothetical protein
LRYDSVALSREQSEQLNTISAHHTDTRFKGQNISSNVTGFGLTWLASARSAHARCVLSLVGWWRPLTAVAFLGEFTAMLFWSFEVRILCARYSSRVGAEITRKVDARGHLWSLGVVLLLCVVGVAGRCVHFYVLVRAKNDQKFAPKIYTFLFCSLFTVFDTHE